MQQHRRGDEGSEHRRGDVTERKQRPLGNRTLADEPYQRKAQQVCANPDDEDDHGRAHRMILLASTPAATPLSAPTIRPSP